MRPLLRIALQLRRFYWWLVRPITRGVRAILVNRCGHILLVRHNYGEEWRKVKCLTGVTQREVTRCHRRRRKAGMSKSSAGTLGDGRLGLEPVRVSTLCFRKSCGVAT